jgi:hypothetical protein
MSDHIDGPRQIGDPSADLTDVLAFTSPENPARTVLAADVFPTCGQEAIFSNAITHSIVVRRAKIAGLGDNAKFETSYTEIRFSFKFDVLERGPPAKGPSNMVLAPCLVARRSASPSMMKREHSRLTELSACLPACAPNHSSSDGYSSVA